MRGLDERTGRLFSYVDLEDRVPATHPLRVIRRIVNDVLAALDGDFAKIYADSGRPSIPPERLLRALLLQAFYTIRSETQLMEQLHYNLLYRWFVGLGVDEPVWVPTVFTKNRERLLEAKVAHKFLAELLNHKQVRGLLSDEHFSVDGTQVAAWASMKSFRAKDGSDEPPSGGRNSERDFQGERRSNDTHASTTDPEARLYRKGKGKPSIYQWAENAEEGGLIAYGPRQTQTYRQRARLLVKVLRGAKPADLPVEQPTHFELVINLKTAKAIGHEIPAGLVLRADKVIE